MNWSALTKKQQQMVGATVILAILQIVILTRVLGGKSSSGGSGASPKAELADLQEKISDARMVIGRSSLVEQSLADSIEKIEALKVYSPTVSDRYAWAYEYVSLRAAQAGVELDSLEEVSYLEDVNSKQAEEPYEINLSTHCDYNRLVEFLWRIEQGNLLVRVKEVMMTTLPDNPDVHQVRIVLQWPAFLEINRAEK